MIKNANKKDIEETNCSLDITKSIRKIGVRLSLDNSICALNLTDENGDDIYDVEWENFDLGRQWKVQNVPAGHEIIGLAVNTKNDENNITRIGFICLKK